MCARKKNRKGAAPQVVARVLHVNNTDLEGRRFNGYDLLKELRPRGIVGKQAVLEKRSASPHVFPLVVSGEDAAYHRACAAEEWRRSMNNLLFPWAGRLMESPEFKRADIVHFHLIHNSVLSLVDLPRIAERKPCVWTFHDPWILTGHCIHPVDCDGWITGCNPCPHPEYVFSMLADRAHLMWGIKRDVLARLDVDIVVASEFMLDMVRRSPLTQHFDNVHLIPFGVEPSAFSADETQAASRAALGIPSDHFVVLLRAHPFELKGLRFAIDALVAAPPIRPTTILTVDQKGLINQLAPDYNLVEMGWVEDASLMGRVFSACDVLLMPSLAEGFGLMALEAMAASRPVVCFEGTALPTLTHAPACGIAVPMRDVPALREALDILAADSDEAQRRGRLGRELAAQSYSHERYLDSLTALYRGVVQRRRTRLAADTRGSDSAETGVVCEGARRAPRFSIVVPAYNAQSTLAETLDAVLALLSEDWECIVVNDGSTDETLAVASEYATRDPRVCVLTQSNQGSGGAYNTGVSRAVGSFVVLCSADDLLLPEHLTAVSAFIDSNPDYDIYSTNGYLWRPDGSLQLLYPDGAIPDSMDLSELMARCFYSVGAAYRRELFNLVGGYRLDVFGEDYDFWLRAVASGARHRYLGWPLSLHRVSSSQKSADLERSYSSDIRILTDLRDSLSLTDEQLAACEAGLRLREQLLAEVRDSSVRTYTHEASL